MRDVRSANIHTRTRADDGHVDTTDITDHVCAPSARARVSVPIPRRCSACRAAVAASPRVTGQYVCRAAAAAAEDGLQRYIKTIRIWYICYVCTLLRSPCIHFNNY